MALKYEGFIVAQAETAREAHDAIAMCPPALVLLDVGLPDEDGFSLVTRLRAEGHTVPIIFLTARDDTEEKVRGLTVGGDDYITKPFGLEDLVACIRACCRGRPAILRRLSLPSG